MINKEKLIKSLVVTNTCIFDEESCEHDGLVCATMSECWECIDKRLTEYIKQDIEREKIKEQNNSRD